MDRQTVRDWVVRNNDEGIAGLSDRPRSDRRPLLDDGGQAALKALVLRGPHPEKDGVSTWRVVDICRFCQQRFGVVYSKNGMLQVQQGFGLY